MSNNGQQCSTPAARDELSIGQHPTNDLLLAILCRRSSVNNPAQSSVNDPLPTIFRKRYSNNDPPSTILHQRSNEYPKWPQAIRAGWNAISSAKDQKKWKRRSVAFFNGYLMSRGLFKVQHFKFFQLNSNWIPLNFSCWTYRPLRTVWVRNTIIA